MTTEGQAGTVVDGGVPWNRRGLVSAGSGKGAVEGLSVPGVHSFHSVIYSAASPSSVLIWQRGEQVQGGGLTGFLALHAGADNTWWPGK